MIPVPVIAPPRDTGAAGIPRGVSDTLDGPLVDSFGRVHTYLRISVTDRCNLRCTYCMPPGGIDHKGRDEILRFDEIVRLARLLAGMGVNKIRVTGGEPLLRRGVVDLVGDLAGIDGVRTLALTTNAVLLEEHVSALKEAGLDRLNVSLDTLRPDRFERIALRSGHDRVLAGIDAALAAGFAPIKLNAVIIGGINDDELPDFVELARSRPINVRFVEYMPFRENGWHDAKLMPYAVMRQRIAERYSLTPLVSDDGSAAVAREFAIEGFAGNIGFITSMTEDFCDGCNRLRMTADGALKTCLFHPAEISLRDALRAGRSDAELARMIRQTVLGKWAGHPPMDQIATGQRSMIEIGG